MSELGISVDGVAYFVLVKLLDSNGIGLLILINAALRLFLLFPVSQQRLQHVVLVPDQGPHLFQRLDVPQPAQVRKKELPLSLLFGSVQLPPAHTNTYCF